MSIRSLCALISIPVHESARCICLLASTSDPSRSASIASFTASMQAAYMSPDLGEGVVVEDLRRVLRNQLQRALDPLDEVLALVLPPRFVDDDHGVRGPVQDPILLSRGRSSRAPRARNPRCPRRCRAAARGRLGGRDGRVSLDRSRTDEPARRPVAGETLQLGKREVARVGVPSTGERGVRLRPAPVPAATRSGRPACRESSPPRPRFRPTQLAERGASGWPADCRSRVRPRQRSERRRVVGISRRSPAHMRFRRGPSGARQPYGLEPAPHTFSRARRAGNASTRRRRPAPSATRSR